LSGGSLKTGHYSSASVGGTKYCAIDTIIHCPVSLSFLYPTKG